MLEYSFSRREKVLLVILAILFVGLIWYTLVYRNTQDQMASIEAQMAQAQAQTDVASSRLEKMALMRDAVDKAKAAGVSPVDVPAFDNTNALMAKLHTVLAATNDYTLEFDELDYSQEGMVVRGVTITFGCEGLPEATAIMNALEHDTYACAIDSVTMYDTAENGIKTNALVGAKRTAAATKSPFAVGLHAVYYEETS